MGFPVPLAEWARGPLRDFVLDAFAPGAGRRDYLADDFAVEQLLAEDAGFGRGLWGLLSLELWHQQYHDRGSHWRRLRDDMLRVDDYAPAGGR